MSRSGADLDGGARVAVVGASSADGHQVREALARAGVPGSRVDLYGVTGGEVVLSEYDGEARLVQQPEPGEVGRHDVVFVCETGEISRKLAAAAPAGTLLIDLVGAFDTGERLPGTGMLDLGQVPITDTWFDRMPPEYADAIKR